MSEIDRLAASALKHMHDPVKSAELSEELRRLMSLTPDVSTAYKTYASIEDPAFQSSLLSKKEFFDRRIERIADVTDFEKAAEGACSPSSNSTKAFELSENQAFIRNFVSPRTPYGSVLLYHDVGVGKTCSAISIAERFPQRRVTILAPNNVQTAFRAQMFDATKMDNQCTGRTYVRSFVGLADLMNLNGKGIDLEKESIDQLNAHAQKVISQRYAFKGFTKFANAISKLSDVEVAESYAKHVFIVDEAHNLRSQKESGTKPGYRALKRVLQLAPGTKLVLLTATPMYNDAREIVDLLNLLLINSNRKPLNRKRLFADDGTLLEPNALARACVGYISHVSGRNPLRFPILLEPIDDAKSVKYAALPTIDVGGEKIERHMRIKATHLTCSEMSREQYAEYTRSGVNSVPVEEEEEDEDKKEGSEGQEAEDTEGIPPSFKPGFEISNIAYPRGNNGNNKRIKGSSAMFWSCFRRAPGKEFAVDYTVQRFLDPVNVGRWSCKFKTIIDRILSSEGIVFVYSRFLWAGLVPFAIALEEHGFARYGHRTILHDKTSNVSNVSNASNGKYIMLTSDTSLCSKAKFAQDLATVVAPDNSRGQRVRVILACGVATEGIDFKCVRSVHLMDPWYHNNKKAQIIGRASRNCSHADLPVPLRNVTVYLHASLPPSVDGEERRETVDLHAYRISEFKQSKIDTVERLLKAVSVDCELNRHAQQDEALAGARVSLITAQGIKLDKYEVAKNLSASFGTCIVDSNPPKPGSDASTLDPWYHAPDAIDRHLDLVLHAFSSGKQSNLSYAELRSHTKSRMSPTFDETIFGYALQKGIEDGKLEYRGGVYVLAKGSAHGVHEKAACSQRVVPVLHATRKTSISSTRRTTKP